MQDIFYFQSFKRLSWCLAQKDFILFLVGFDTWWMSRGYMERRIGKSIVTWSVRRMGEVFSHNKQLTLVTAPAPMTTDCSCTVQSVFRSRVSKGKFWLNVMCMMMCTNLQIINLNPVTWNALATLKCLILTTKMYSKYKMKVYFL